MAHITLVLPYALPLPEFAPDLIRALDAPALACLLSRRSAEVRHQVPEGARAAPHEAWLAQALELSSDGRPAFANAAMRGFGLEANGGAWHLVTPGHIQIARSHLMMADPRQLDLNEADSRALFDSARALCEELGHELLYGDLDTWFLRADDWSFDTATPDTVVGMDLTDFMPKSAEARAFRRLQNEVQMAWHAHPANSAREARRLAPVNAFWVWGAGGAGKPSAPPIATYATPGWLTALGAQRIGNLDVPAGAFERDGIIIAGNLAETAIAADWGGWLEQMRHLESALFAPILAGVKSGRVRQLRLVLSSREGLREFATTPMAQRKFWRSPSLDALASH